MSESTIEEAKNYIQEKKKRNLNKKYFIIITESRGVFQERGEFKHYKSAMSFIRVPANIDFCKTVHIIQCKRIKTIQFKKGKEIVKRVR